MGDRVNISCIAPDSISRGRAARPYRRGVVCPGSAGAKTLETRFETGLQPVRPSRLARLIGTARSSPPNSRSMAQIKSADLHSVKLLDAVKVTPIDDALYLYRTTKHAEAKYDWYNLRFISPI
jgi:hypothetical protein